MSEEKPRVIEVSAGGLTSTMAGPGIVVAVLFLIFGVGFIGFAVSETSSSETGLMVLQIGFGVLWVAVCTTIIVGYARLLRRRPNVAPDSLLHIEEVESAAVPAEGGPDFEARLRKLDRLYRDGLLTESEFTRKRDEILGDKW